MAKQTQTQDHPSLPRLFGREVSPLTVRRWQNFRRNKRGFWSLWIFLSLFCLSLFAELIANDKPLMVVYDGEVYAPVFVEYPETTFGGIFETEADYRDPEVAALIAEKGWSIWPLIRFDHRTINYALPVPAPAPPSAENWLGTDDQGRDVAARLIYGFRISVLFGLALTFFSSLIGIAAGAVQGYFGGWTDLLFQRFIEIWSGLPVLYLLIILASIVEPNFWWLLGIMLLFSWMALVDVVRAENQSRQAYLDAYLKLMRDEWTAIPRAELESGVARGANRDPVVRQVNDLPDDSADRSHIITLRKRGNHLVMRLLLVSLRPDQQEVEDREDRPEHEQHAERALPLRGSAGLQHQHVYWQHDTSIVDRESVG